MAPVNFAIEDLPTSRRVRFSWAPPPTESDFIANYTLTCTTKVPGVVPVTTTYDKVGSHTLGGFRLATEYSCSVFASNSVGHGPSSVSINVTTSDESKPFWRYYK